MGLKSWFTWSIAAALFLMQFFLQMGIGVIVKQLGDSFHISAFGIGLLASSYYVLYILLQMPAGMVVDHLGARASLIFSATFMGIGCLVFSQAHLFWVAILSRCLMGFASAFIFVSTLALIRHWFPSKKFGLLAGLTETAGLIGVLFGTVPFAALLQVLTWRHLFVIMGLIIFVLQLLTIFFVQNHPQKHTFSRKKLKWGQFLHNSKIILSNRGLWINGIYAGIIFSILSVFITLWGIPFLKIVNSFNNVQATFVSSVGIIAIAVGIPLMGLVYHELKETKYFMLLCSFYCAFFISWILFLTPSSLWLNSILMFLLGLGASVYVFNFAIANRISSHGLAASLLGFTNSLCLLITPFFQPITGWVLEYFATYRKITPSTANLLIEYRVSLSLLPIMLVLSGFLALWIPSES